MRIEIKFHQRQAFIFNFQYEFQPAQQVDNELSKRNKQ